MVCLLWIIFSWCRCVCRWFVFGGRCSLLVMCCSFRCLFSIVCSRFKFCLLCVEIYICLWCDLFGILFWLLWCMLVFLMWLILLNISNCGRLLVLIVVSILLIWVMCFLWCGLVVLIICSRKLVLCVLDRVEWNVVIRLCGRLWMKLMVLVSIMLLFGIVMWCMVGFSVVNSWLVV